jgi:hypothetical protein
MWTSKVHDLMGVQPEMRFLEVRLSLRNSLLVARESSIYTFKYQGTLTILIRLSPPTSSSAVSICPR